MPFYNRPPETLEKVEKSHEKGRVNCVDLSTDAKYELSMYLFNHRYYNGGLEAYMDIEAGELELGSEGDKSFVSRIDGKKLFVV